MIKNYFKIAWRNITSRKFYTFLNITGLAIALNCCMLIYLYISYNLSFDTYHRNSKNIFRLVYELHLQTTEYDKGASFAEFSALKTQVPQVRDGAFLINNQSFIVDVNGSVTKRFKEENTVAFTSSDWFKMFSYHWLMGNPARLDEPGNAVLSLKTVRKYFGDADPIGKILLLNKQQIKVSGVVDDSPYNSDLKSDIYISLSSLTRLIPLYAADKYFFTDWGNISGVNNAFITLANADQQRVVEGQMANLLTKHMGADAAKIFKLKLLPLADVHFDTRYGGTVQKSLLWNLVIIGLLIIAIAIFNYINLTVAQQAKRSAEIATRKVLGGSSAQIFMQFITESLITSAIAVAAAVLFVLLLLPAANTWLFADDPVHIVSYANLFLFAGLVLVFITIGAGAYPALVLSRISIAQVLKNNVLNLKAGGGRRVMVIFQNIVTQSLIICTIIIVMQVHFLRNTDIGFNRKSVVIIPVGQISAAQKDQFNESLKRIPDVKSFSFCNKPPSSDSKRGATIDFDDRPKWEAWPARFVIGDSAYRSTFGLNIVAGRNIRNNQAKPEFLINETMAVMLEGQHKDLVLGKQLTAGDIKGVIVGIVKDFNVKALTEPMEPTVLLESSDLQTNLAVKLSGWQTALTLNDLQKEYRHILPDQLFSYQFVDEQIARLYKKEDIQQRLIWIASSVAIIISSLGLIGLVSLVALQRTKEIGIRKVLGATAAQISLMLFNDFLWMVLLAFLIACPVSWWAMSKWLQGFAYRININWWIFALAGIISILIAIATVSFQAIKAAIANPVKSLRSE